MSVITIMVGRTDILNTIVAWNPNIVICHENTTHSARENMWIYYLIIVVNLLHVSATFCGYLQGDVFMKGVLQRQPYKCTDIK
jgi:hypothetical protein